MQIYLIYIYGHDAVTFVTIDDVSKVSALPEASFSKRIRLGFDWIRRAISNDIFIDSSTCLRVYYQCL
jgi:hypothetical protein